MKRPVKSTEILLWVYGVGLAGLILPFTQRLFVSIIPLNLIFAAVFLFWQMKPDRRVIVTGLFIAVTSFLIEAAGVNTGKVFGCYSYGKALGPALLNTPLIIGLNWFVLIYCTNVMARQLWSRFADKTSGRKSKTAEWIFIIVTASMFMVIYDLFLEPAAVRLDMWSWERDAVPLQNYAAWFVISVIYHIATRLFGEEKINSRAVPLLMVQLLFFAVIDIYYAFA